MKKISCLAVDCSFCRAEIDFPSWRFMNISFYSKTHLVSLFITRSVEYHVLTLNTFVTSFEVVFKLFITRFSVSKVGIDHFYAAVSPAGTVSVQIVYNVAVTTQETKVRANTSADLYATVASCRDQYDLVCLTCSFKSFVLTVLLNLSCK